MLVASVSTDRLLCTDRLILDLIYLEDRWKIHRHRQIRHVVYGIPSYDKKFYVIPSLEFLTKYTEFLHTEFYTSPHIDIKSSLNISLIFIIQYFPPPSSFSATPTTYNSTV